MKDKKNKIFFLIVIILLCINVYNYVIPIFKSSEINIENEVAELIINSNDLVKSFSNDEKKYTNLYAGKIIEVTGYIKEISNLNNRNTIILNSKTETFGVICDINSTQKEKIKYLKIDQKIRVKGICKGFLKDVILLNCFIDTIPNE